MVNNENKAFSIEEAIEVFLQQVSQRIDWKYLKSSKCVKKTIGDLVFQVQLNSSKWNRSYESVEIQCECHIWCKRFDKVHNVKSSIGYYKFDAVDSDWWDITTEDNLTLAIEKVVGQIKESVLPLSIQFEENFVEATKGLAHRESFDRYHIKLEFIDVYAGREYVKDIAQYFYQSLSEVYKQDVIRYKKGAKDKPWMINPSNLKYIVDNDIVRDLFE